MSRSARIRRSAENVIIVCLLLIMVLSAWKIITIMRTYKQNQASYDDLYEKIQLTDYDTGIDFDALRKINPDVVGWLYYEDTPINYPVVQGSDNSKYLNTLFDGSYGVFGTLFADAFTEKPFRQFNTIVYGHHMRDGSMLACLKNLKSEEYCEKHPKLSLTTPEGKFDLEIWAFLNQPADSAVYTTNISDRDECQKYINMIEQLAEYTVDQNVTPDDRLVILSTCAYEYQNARYMVVCKMTPAQL